jgi:hypothetical protein
MALLLVLPAALLTECPSFATGEQAGRHPLQVAIDFGGNSISWAGKNRKATLTFGKLLLVD